jgi:hypothetical protein
MSVNANGISFGNACTVNQNATATETNTTESLFNTTKDPIPNNAVSQAIANTSKATGLGTTLVWLIFMLAIALFIFYGAVELKIASEDMRYIWGLIAFIELGLLFVGTKLGFVPVAFIIVLVILGVIVAALMLSRRALPQ